MVKHTAHNGQNKGSNPFKSISFFIFSFWKNRLIGKSLVSKTMFEGSSPSSFVDLIYKVVFFLFF